MDKTQQKPAPKPAALKHPFPIQPAPIGILGLMFSVTLTINALSMDQWALSSPNEENFRILSGFYHRKIIEPALYIQGTLLLLLFLGVLTYITHFVGVFKRHGNTTRKIADVIGFVLFMFNVYLGLFVVAPIEKLIGSSYLSKKEIITPVIVAELYWIHLLQIIICLSILVQQFVSFKNQQPALPLVIPPGKKEN